MSSNFAVLWGELKKTTMSTQVRDTNFTREREDIMKTLGMLGPVDKSSTGGKGKPSRGREVNKYHGKKARALENSAHQKAMHEDNKAKSIKRLEVQSLVHEVESKTDISKSMAKFIKAQQPIPPRLLKALVGGKMTKPRAQLPPLLSPKKKKGYIPPPSDNLHVPRKVISMHTHSSNKWPAEERKHLVDLYCEMERPQGAQADLWKIYYHRVADRHRSVYPQRKSKEIVDKLVDMINKRQFHEQKEIDYWKQQQGCKISTAAADAISQVERTLELEEYASAAAGDMQTLSALSLQASRSPSKAGSVAGSRAPSAAPSAANCESSSFNSAGAKGSRVSAGSSRARGVGSRVTSGGSLVRASRSAAGSSVVSSTH